MATEKRSKLEREIIKIEKQIENQQTKVEEALAKDDFERAEKEEKKLRELSIQADVRRQRVGQLIQDELVEQQKEKVERRDLLNEQLAKLSDAVESNVKALTIIHSIETRLHDRDNELWENFGQDGEDGLHAWLDEQVKQIKSLTPPVDLEGCSCMDALVNKLISEKVALDQELAGPPKPTPLQLEYAERDRQLLENGSTRMRFPLIEASQRPPSDLSDLSPVEAQRIAETPSQTWTTEA